METHAELIRDQFTRQAIPFATAPSMSDAKVLQLLVDFSRVSGEDTAPPGNVEIKWTVAHHDVVQDAKSILER